MKRIKRVESLMKQTIAEIIQRDLISNIGFISIIDVEINKDLSAAKVFYSQIGSNTDKDDTLEQLKKAAKYIKGQLGKKLDIKTIPNLRFIFDESIENGSRILNTLNTIKTG